MKTWWVTVPVLVVGAALMAAACGDDDDSAVNGADDTMAVDREIIVKMSDQLRFEPDMVRVKVGERVRLVADNEGSGELHDFSVHMMPADDVMMEGAEHGRHSGGTGGFALHVAAEPGEHAALMFTAAEPGEYEFFCSVPGHAEAGMKGAVVVDA